MDALQSISNHFDGSIATKGFFFVVGFYLLSDMWATMGEMEREGHVITLFSLITSGLVGIAGLVEWLDHRGAPAASLSREEELEGVMATVFSFLMFVSQAVAFRRTYAMNKKFYHRKVDAKQFALILSSYAVLFVGIAVVLNS